jgi:hypothetical protein
MFRGKLAWFVPHFVRLLVTAEDSPNASTLMEKVFDGGRLVGGRFDLGAQFG